MVPFDIKVKGRASKKLLCLYTELSGGPSVLQPTRDTLGSLPGGIEYEAGEENQNGTIQAKYYGAKL